MSHPLLTATPSNLSGKLDIPPLTAGLCLTGPKDLQDWLAKSIVNIKNAALFFGYTAGTMAAATAEDRPYPRFVFDDSGRYLGLALWMPDLQGWSIGGQIGELMTLLQTLGSPTDDLAARPMAGWHLADGDTAGIPDLSGEAAFWGEGYYTVGYLG